MWLLIYRYIMSHVLLACMLLFSSLCFLFHHLFLYGAISAGRVWRIHSAWQPFGMCEVWIEVWFCPDETLFIFTLISSVSFKSQNRIACYTCMSAILSWQWPANVESFTLTVISLWLLNLKKIRPYLYLIARFHVHSFIPYLPSCELGSILNKLGVSSWSLDILLTQTYLKLLRSLLCWDLVHLTFPS